MGARVTSYPRENLAKFDLQDIHNFNQSSKVVEMWALGVLLEGLTEAANDARAILSASDFISPLTSKRIGSP
jgi:hypothetical protein